MKNTVSTVLLAICFFTFLTAWGQENSIWYSYNLYGDKQKITELEEVILYEEVREEASPYPARVDTVYIEKRINDSIYVVVNPRGNEEFALMAASQIVEGTIKAVGFYHPSNSAQAVETAYTNAGLPAWNALTVKWIFSEAKTKLLEDAPGYDEVTREAMIEALTVRESVGPMLKEYLEENPDTKPSYLYRFVELKAQQKFIALGYNPYKQVEYNFEKQFEGDEEVIKLLTTPMSYE
ncbi:MAG: hypothetical protein AAF717_01820 [Bacteroidota bacterium]